MIKHTFGSANKDLSHTVDKMSVVLKVESETKSKIDADKKPVALLLRQSPPGDIDSARIKQESPDFDDDSCDGNLHDVEHSEDHNAEVKDNPNVMAFEFIKQEKSESGKNQYVSERDQLQRDGAPPGERIDGYPSAPSASSVSNIHWVG